MIKQCTSIIIVSAKILCIKSPNKLPYNFTVLRTTLCTVTSVTVNLNWNLIYEHLITTVVILFTPKKRRHYKTGMRSKVPYAHMVFFPCSHLYKFYPFSFPNFQRLDTELCITASAHAYAHTCSFCDYDFFFVYSLLQIASIFLHISNNYSHSYLYQIFFQKMLCILIPQKNTIIVI